jgi:hypothetical protein
MARGRSRPERRPGRQSRDPVDAILGGLDVVGREWGLDDDPDGSAGVREPRRPKPLGPMSGAGERPVPEPFLAAVLPDPRS